MQVDRNSLRYFIDRWMAKALNANNNDDIYGFVDQFVFTYIAFNSLYNTAAYVREGQVDAVRLRKFSMGGLPKPPFNRYRFEQKRATVLVEEVCGKTALADVVRSHARQVDTICNLLETGRIYLYETPQGDPDQQADAELSKKVRSGESEPLLRLIYLVRCNLFHGAKALSTTQRELLIACTQILTAVVPLFLGRIESQIQRRQQHRHDDE